MALAPGDTSTWQGGTSGDFDTAANWSPAEVPIDDVHVVCPDGNAVSITSGLDQSDKCFRSFVTQPGYSGNIGASGSPLQCAAQNTTDYLPAIVHRGSGTLYLHSNCTDGGVTYCDPVIIDSSNVATAAVLSSSADDNYSAISVMSGNVEIVGTDTAVTNLFVSSLIERPTSPTVTIDSTPTLTNVHMLSGTVTNSAAITTMIMAGGVWTQSAGGITTIHMTSGHFSYEGGGPLNTLILMGGVFDTTQTATAKTITLLVHQGGQLLEGPGLTISAEAEWFAREYYGR